MSIAATETTILHDAYGHLRKQRHPAGRIETFPKNRPMLPFGKRLRLGRSARSKLGILVFEKCFSPRQRTPAEQRVHDYARNHDVTNWGQRDGRRSGSTGRRMPSEPYDLAVHTAFLLTELSLSDNTISGIQGRAGPYCRPGALECAMQVVAIEWVRDRDKPGRGKRYGRMRV